jgi:endonuclease-3
MIVLSARASDAMVNNLAPALFQKYPSFQHLQHATPDDLYPYLRVPGFRKKAEWIMNIAQEIGNKGSIPTTMTGLTALKGFGRKSANVFMSQTNREAEGVIVDLHTLRVAPRLGIAEGTDPIAVEKELMKKVHKSNWHLLGMSLTFLGRETCRPKNPRCGECVLCEVCDYNRKR